MDLRAAMEINEQVPGKIAEYYSHNVLNHANVPTKLLPKDYKRNMYPHSDVAVWEKHKKVMLDPRFAPLMAQDFAGLPKTFIYAARRDVARDDALLYKAQLENAGIKVDLYFDEDGFHGAFWSVQNRDKVYKRVADFIF